MTIIFSPSGKLNVSADPSDLEESGSGNNIISYALTRCKNLTLDRPGMARTRAGSQRINTTPISKTISLIIEKDGDRYSFSTSIYKNESSIKDNLEDGNWSGIVYSSYGLETTSIFALNGTDRKRIDDDGVNEWGIDAPTQAPTLESGAGGNLIGKYNAKYTYVRKVDELVTCESNMSPAAAKSIVLNKTSLVVNVTQPTDPQVTHIRLYRTINDDDSHYYYDQEIPINKSYDFSYTHDWEANEYVAGNGYKFTTTDTDNSRECVHQWELTFTDRTDSDSHDGCVYTAPYGDFDSNSINADLGSTGPTNHNRPPEGSFVAGPTYSGICFILKDNRVYYCLNRQPEYWPETYYIEVGSKFDPCRAMVFWNGQPYIITERSVYQLQGTGANTFFPIPMAAATGTKSQTAVLALHGIGIFRVGTDGIYVYSGNDKNVTNADFSPIFQGIEINDIPAANGVTRSWLISWRNRVYFCYASAADDYPRYIFRLDLSNNQVSFFDYGIKFTAVTIDHTNDRILVADNNGYMWIIEDSSKTDDDGADISWDIQSKDFILQTRLHFPRWATYDIAAASATSCIGKIVLNGVTHQEHIINTDRSVKQRLIKTGNGARAAIRVTGSGPVTIYAVEME